jgi:hypothetical protein
VSSHEYEEVIEYVDPNPVMPYGYRYDPSQLPPQPKFVIIDLSDYMADPDDIDDFVWTEIPDYDTTWNGEYDEWNKFVTMVFGLPFILIALVVLPLGYTIYGIVLLVTG